MSFINSFYIFLVVIIILCSQQNVSAQSNAEYDFEQMSVVDNDRFSSDVDCSSGDVWDFRQPTQKPSSSLKLTDDSCKLRFNRAGAYVNGGMYKEAYDTGKYYIETCYARDESFHVFSDITAAVNYYPKDDTMRYIRYREWLLSVLYLNTTNPLYYCSCVAAIMGTFPYGEHKGWRSSMAVLKYLLDRPDCYSQGKLDLWNDTWRSLRDEWAQGDTSVPFNDSLPSLEDIGLGILLTGGDVNATQTLRGNDILSFTASTNPFEGQTTLNFELQHMAHITIDLYDELGRTLTEPLASRVFNPGKQEIAVDGRGLPPGAVYARLQTGSGEVRTVKLLHLK